MTISIKFILSLFRYMYILTQKISPVSLLVSEEERNGNLEFSDISTTRVKRNAEMLMGMGLLLNT